MPDGVKTTAYLPDRLHELVKTLAERERRSTNNMIVVLLDEAVRKRQVDVATEALGGRRRR
jgi:hypothetical protein